MGVTVSHPDVEAGESRPEVGAAADWVRAAGPAAAHCGDLLTQREELCDAKKLEATHDLVTFLGVLSVTLPSAR